MEKFIPFEKLSKKKQRELNAKKRNTWGPVSPVTRKPENPKAYNRQKAQKRTYEPDSVPFSLPEKWNGQKRGWMVQSKKRMNRKREGAPMDLNDIYQLTDETEQIQRTYEFFNEDTRLNRSKAARVEFLTTVRYIERYLKPGNRILDVGAGAGEYSLYFARKGYEVCALELAENNIKAFQRKLSPEDRIDLVQGNAMDLSRYGDDSFDVVLVFGPLYHLHREADRQKCISEAKRVCKLGGKLFFAFISNDMVILTEFSYRPDYFTAGDYDKETFRLEDFPFVFHTVDGCREMLRAGGVRILHEVAADGVSELLEDKINAMSDADYAQYLRYHAYICEKPEFLGMTNHLLFVGEK